MAIAAGVAAAAASSASKKYDREAYEDDDVPPEALFVERKGAEFLPADEMEPIVFTGDRRMQVTCRGVKYTFKPHTSADADMHDDWRHADRHVPDWHEDGAAELAARKGAPEAPGAAALLEWGQRPFGPPPPWVEEAVEAYAGGVDSESQRLIRTAPVPYLGALAYRLEMLPSPGKTALLQAVRGAGMRTAMGQLIAAAVCAGLMLIPLCMLIVGANSDNDALVPLGILGLIVLGVVALILLIAGLVRMGQFNSGRKRVQKQAGE
jgi:hypothetical protein